MEWQIFQGTSRKVHLAVICLLVLSLGSISVVSVLLFKSHLDRTRYEKSLFRLSKDMQAFHLSQKDLERHFIESRHRLTDYREETEVALAHLRRERSRLEDQLLEATRMRQRREETIKDLESELIRATRRIQDLERANQGGERIIRGNMGGVAFLEVFYTFEDKDGRIIRYSKTDPSGEPVYDSAGETPVSVTGDGSVVSLYSSGTAFLVKAGMMLTSRHVAEPWWRDESAKRFTQSGFRPAILLFRAYFPGIKEAFPVHLHKLSKQADVALVLFDPKGTKLPILKLDHRLDGAIVGNPVLLIGFPAGKDALLARVETATLKKIIGRRGKQIGEVTEELSKRGLIRPLTTWGHLSDVQADYVIYDALTTSGGSGSPLLNTQGRVIGINQSMLKSFSGSNFGVPIRFGMELMD